MKEFKDEVITKEECDKDLIVDFYEGYEDWLKEKEERNFEE